MKLRRLQQASFLPCTVENDKRQLQAQSQSRSTSKSDISSGAFLVVLQLTMDIMLSPPSSGFLDDWYRQGRVVRLRRRWQTSHIWIERIEDSVS